MKLMICSVLFFAAVMLTGENAVQAGLIGHHEFFKGLHEPIHEVFGNGLLGFHHPPFFGILAHHRPMLPFGLFGHHGPEESVASQTVVATETKTAEAGEGAVAASAAAASVAA